MWSEIFGLDDNAELKTAKAASKFVIPEVPMDSIEFLTSKPSVKTDRVYNLFAQEELEKEFFGEDVCTLLQKAADADDTSNEDQLLQKQAKGAKREKSERRYTFIDGTVVTGAMNYNRVLDLYTHIATGKTYNGKFLKMMDFGEVA